MDLPSRQDLPAIGVWIQIKLFEFDPGLTGKGSSSRTVRAVAPVHLSSRQGKAQRQCVHPHTPIRLCRLLPIVVKRQTVPTVVGPPVQ